MEGLAGWPNATILNRLHSWRLISLDEISMSLVKTSVPSIVATLKMLCGPADAYLGSSQGC